MKYDIKSIEKRKKKEVMIKNVLKVILILLIYNMILLGISAMDNNEKLIFLDLNLILLLQIAWNQI